MAISGDYPKPVTVNGFSCRNCQDVSLAKRHIDPDHPLSGPYGANADNDPTLPFAERTEKVSPAKVLLPPGVGQRLDISA
jgi:hypothetical protein